MSYQSIQFLLFTGIVLIFYYGPGRRHQRIVLAIANLCFYCIAGIRYLPFLLATAAVTFFCARSIGRIYGDAELQMADCNTERRKEIRAQAKGKAKRSMLPGLLIPILLLAICKYTGFFLRNLDYVLNAVHIPQIPIFRMILPLGISFYTFMAISYVLDVYWKRYAAEEHFLPYAVFLSYFPHVVQGPISRFNEFNVQLQNPVAFETKNLVFGAEQALWGFFKKLVVADRLGMFVDGVLARWSDHRGFILIAAIVAYSIQIYADFSGCIDIVTGVSEMLGIRLRKNFNHPYFSRTMGEFWRRWHISLQEWFKDYVYFPVSASETVRKAKKYFKQKGKKRASELFSTCFPILVVWLITGIWHGADWKYVVWGLFHAMLLIGSKLLENTFSTVNRRLHVPTENFLWKLWQMLRTFFLCCVGRVFFRADSLGMALGIIRKMLDPRITMAQILHPSPSFGMTAEDAVLSLIVVFVLLIVDIVQERIHIRETLSKKNIVFRWLIIYVGLLAVLILGVYGPGFDASSFIYEQF